MFGLSSFSSKKSAEEVSGESRVLVNTLDWALPSVLWQDVLLLSGAHRLH